MLLSNKVPRFSLIVLVALAMGQVSCLRNASNPASPGVTEDTTSDFKVLEVTGKSITASEENSWQVPTQKTYEFRVCLLSRITNSQLPVGQAFRVQAVDGSQLEKTTDNLGCINWTEVVPFNYGADSMYIEKKRNLIGKGTYRGTTPLHFAINPWMQYRSDQGQEVVDLQRGNTNIPADRLIREEAGAAALSGLFSRSSSRNIFIDPSPSLEIIDTGDLPDGKLFDIVLQLKPYIEPLNLNKDRDKIYFNKGRFKVYVQLVADYVGESNNSQRLVLTPELAPQEIDIKTDSTIVFKQRGIPLKRRVTTGQVQLAVKVVPIDTPEGFDLESYEGLFNTGPFNTIFKSSSPTIVQGTNLDEGFDYASHVERTANFEELRNTGWAHRLPPVQYSNLDPRFVQVRPGETSTERTVFYRVSTQVTDGVHGGPIKLQPFTVVHPDGREEAVSTDHEGYLYWNDDLPHMYYYRERRILRNVKIIHHRSQNKANHLIALNPWDEGWTFGADIRSGILEKEYDESGKVIDWLSLNDEQLQTQIKAYEAKYDRYQELKPNLLFIDAFRYQTIRFRYVIDEFLTLNVKKAVVMALDPLVQRDTLYRGRVFEPLRDGVYLAKIALVKYFIDPFQNGIHLVKCDPEAGNCPCPEGDLTCTPESQKYNVQRVSEGGEARKGEYTTVIKKLIRVQAGRITTPLEFSMRDLRMMSIRSQIMIELETIDERALLRDNIVNRRLEELEKTFYEINPETMTDAEKQDFKERYGYLPEELSPEAREQLIAERAAEYLAEKENLLKFVDEAKTELERTRAAQSTAQLRRFEMVEKIENGELSGNPQAEYEKENPMISLLKREDWRELISAARANLSQMELDMKQHWAKWDSDWDSVVKGIHSGEYIHENETFRRNYYDYLLVAQTFLMDQGLEGAVINEEEMERLAINNYTQNPITPLIDLNLYRNKSGLKRRTFIGPCTLVANDNLSEMRPTDTVDEKYCDSIDCGQELYQPRVPLPDNSEFENSAHHDSLKPFANMHVDEVIVMHKENERRYEMEMDALSQMGNFVDAFNMSFVSLTDQPIYKYKQGCTFNGQENCFPETQDNRIASSHFIKVLNEAKMIDLLGRFYLVNPSWDLEALDDQVSRENSLEPLWDRTRRNPGIILSALGAKGERIPLNYIPLDYNERLRAANPDYNPSYGLGYGIGADPYSMQNNIDSRIYMETIHAGKEDVKLDSSDITRWLSEGSSKLKLEDSLRICYALSLQAAQSLEDARVIGQRGLEKNEYETLNNVEKYLLHKCLSHVRYLPESNKVYLDGVHFDRRFKIKKAGSYEHVRGLNMNINVGIEFSISSYKDSSTTTTAGVNDAGVLGMTGAGIGAYAGGPVGAVIGASAGLLIASMSNSSTNGVNMGQGTAVNAATFLVIQKADFNINILEHEKCLSLKLGREFTETVNADHLYLKDEVKLKDEKVQTSLSRGFMICEGKTDTTPIKIPESYYYVTQHFTAGDMLDDVNLLNHVWLLALRGQRDYNEFVRILNSKQIDQDGDVISDKEIYDYPISRLGRVYKQVVPTFPGLYSVQD